MIQESKPRHSRLGIASFIIAIAVGIIVPIVIIAWAIMAAGKQGQDAEKLIPAGIVMGWTLILAYCGNLTGLGLGIAAVRQKDRNRIFAIIGLCLNAAGSVIGTLFVVTGFLIH